MTKPVGTLFSALMLCAGMIPAHAGEAAPSAAANVAKAPIAAPALNPRSPATGASSATGASTTGAPSNSPAAPGEAVAALPSPLDPKKRFRRPAPLKRLTFSARQGFSLRMVSSQEVTAEIRNGAGRTLARGDYSLEAGDWTLRPRNLPPGLYTVMLRTGPQLRALRMKIEDSERGDGLPEWVLEKSLEKPLENAPESSGLEDVPSQQGAFVIPSPD